MRCVTAGDSKNAPARGARGGNASPGRAERYSSVSPARDVRPGISRPRRSLRPSRVTASSGLRRLQSTFNRSLVQNHCGCRARVRSLQLPSGVLSGRLAAEVHRHRRLARLSDSAANLGTRAHIGRGHPSPAPQASPATAYGARYGVVCPSPHVAGVVCPSPRYPAGMAAPRITRYEAESLI